MSLRRLASGVGTVLLLAAPARADSPGDHLVGLFVQGCLPFVGNVAGLRDWAARLHLPVLPEAGRRAFLQDQPGVVFDATDPGGKLVLISAADGNCDAVADKADPALAHELEHALARLGVSLTVSADRDDPEEKALHYREYIARKGDRSWRIVVSTGKPGSDAHPMLSASPE